MDCLTVLKRRGAYGKLAVLFSVLSMGYLGVNLLAGGDVLAVAGSAAFVSLAMLFAVLVKDYTRLAAKLCLSS